MAGIEAVATPGSIVGNPAAPTRPLRERIGAAWGLFSPYWRSEERWRAWSLLVTIIVIDLLRVYVAVTISYWQRDYWDALANHDIAAFWQLVKVFLVIIVATTVLSTARIWFFQALEIRWRAWMTDIFINRWLNNNAYYHVAHAGDIDNPDQRIGEDLKLLATKSLRLSLGLLDNIVRLFSYAAIVWSLSGVLAFSLGGSQIEIPGYMLWVAVIFAVFGSLLMEKIGYPMVQADYLQQSCEAHFRFLMMRIRENAEQIAFYSGARAEYVRLQAAFQTIKENWRHIMDYTRRIYLFEECYIEIGAFLPLLIIAPRFFAGEITLGAVQQLTLAFARVRGAMSWFIFSYKELALLRSVFQRLLEFETAMTARAESGIAITRNVQPDRLHVAALKIHHPDGAPMVQVDELSIAAGERWLVRGYSGVGKSTLLRTLAGLWPHGSGEIFMPAGQEMFLPQHSYLPVGSLRACLCYPSDEQWFGIHECLEVLRAVRLEFLGDQLNDSDNWARRLSPGEQQRLAFARVLLHKPSWLFLDEATSSLDPANEAAMYRLLTEHLPGTCIVSVAHRSSLAAFHGKALDLGAGGAVVSLL
ncbi:ABC transporter [Betaproteobacteria bacterium]|nr:ABC transporter [Betaproteobacteria bacterium]